MANNNGVFGFRAVDNLRQPGTLGRISRYYHSASDANQLMIGDPVVIDTAGSGLHADSTEGLAAVTIATAGSGIHGVIVGFDQIDNVAPASTNLYITYCPASTAMYVMVADDPDTVFEVQMGISGTPTVACFENNANMVIAAGNTSTGNSGCYLNTTNATTSADFRILGLANHPDNVVGQYMKVRVLPNIHGYKQTTGGL